MGKRFDMKTKVKRSVYAKMNVEESLYLLLQRVAKERDQSLSAMLRQIVIADLYRGGHLSDNMLLTLSGVHRERVNVP